MPWFRLEDGFADNPKVSAAGNAAVGLWIRCATWSARVLTDGRIPVRVARSFGRPAEAQALEQAGLWVLDAGEYVIPDYLDYNPSAAVVKQRRKADAERKRQASGNGYGAAEHDPVTGRFVTRGSAVESDQESDQESDRDSA